MKKVTYFFLLLIISSYTLQAQTVDKKLKKIIEKEITSFNGEIGIYIKNLKTGKVVSINADTLFPTASIIKVPILLGVMDKMRKKELFYDSLHTYRDSLFYAGEDILASFKDGEKIRLKKIIMLMATTSDNTASLWLQSLAGTGTRINYLRKKIDRDFNTKLIHTRTGFGFIFTDKA